MEAMKYQASTTTLTRLGSEVEDFAHRSIAFLNAIESTIEALCYDQKLYRAYADIAHRFLDHIRNVKPTKLIDTDGAVADSYLKAQIATKELHALLTEKYRYAAADVRLTEEDGVADEYRRLIEIVADLHNCLNDLRWALGEHDADFYEAKGPVLTSPEDIEKQLA